MLKCPLQVGDTAGDDLDWEGVDDSQARLTALVTMLSPLFRQQTFKAGEHLANQVGVCLLCCQRHFVAIAVFMGRHQLGSRQHSCVAELAAAAARHQGSCSCSAPALVCSGSCAGPFTASMLSCWEACVFAAWLTTP